MTSDACLYRQGITPCERLGAAAAPGIVVRPGTCNALVDDESPGAARWMSIEETAR